MTAPCWRFLTTGSGFLDVLLLHLAPFAASWRVHGSMSDGSRRRTSGRPLALPTSVVLLEPMALPTSVVLLEPTANSGAWECKCGILSVLADRQILSTTRHSQTLTVAS